MTQETQIMTVDRQSAVLMELIERGVSDPQFSVEKLSQLLDVKERWEREEARKAFVAALSRFKQNPPTIIKDQTVSHRGGTYSYAGLGQVVAEVTAALAIHGFSHAWELDQSGPSITVTCVLTHELGHSERVALSGPADDTGSKNQIQQVGSTVTYLQRYTLMSITGLAASDMDDDGVGAGSRLERPQSPSNRAPAPQGILCLIHKKTFGSHPTERNRLVHPMDGGGWCYQDQLNQQPPVNTNTGEIIDHRPASDDGNLSDPGPVDGLTHDQGVALKYEAQINAGVDGGHEINQTIYETIMKGLDADFLELELRLFGGGAAFWVEADGMDRTWEQACRMVLAEYLPVSDEDLPF